MLQLQNVFMGNVAKLIIFAQSNGYTLSAGEMYRTPEQQAIYLKTGRSKTSQSLHLQRLAIDLNIFKDGVLCTRDQSIPLGNYWESLNPNNSWGGRGKSIVDAPHFSMGVDKPEWSRAT